MRHSRAESYGACDRERDLTDQGRADAADTATWLAGRGVDPDLALVSSSRRTRATWEAVRTHATWTAEARFEDGLYAGGPDTVLDLIREVPDDVTGLLVVGHNPTVAYLAQLLDDGDGDPDAVLEMAGGYPTSAVAVLELAGSWSELEACSARLTGFHVGHG
jgi:phosphohistidine phosphatase